MGPLRRLSQGTRHIDAAARDAITREGGREGQETRHDWREPGRMEGRSVAVWVGRRNGHMCPLHPITVPRDLPPPAPTPQRLCCKVLISTEWRGRTGSFRNLMGHEIQEDIKSDVLTVKQVTVLSTLQQCKHHVVFIKLESKIKGKLGVPSRGLRHRQILQVVGSAPLVFHPEEHSEWAST